MLAASRAAAPAAPRARDVPRTRAHPARDSLARDQCGGRGGQQLRVIGRIEEHDVEGLRQPAAAPARRARRRTATDTAASCHSRANSSMAAAARRSFSMKVTCAGAARQRLQSERAAAREQVQHARAGDARLQPVEQGFPHPIRRRTDLHAGGKTQAPAAVSATDDAQDARPRACDSRAPRSASCSRALGATFSAFLDLHQCSRRVVLACHLLGPKRTLRPQYDKFGASF